MSKLSLPRRRGKTNFIAFRNTIHNNVANSVANDVAYNVPFDIFDAFLSNMLLQDRRDENTFFIPAQTSPGEITFFDTKSDRGYDLRSNFGFTFGNDNITGNFIFGYAPEDFVPSRDSPDEGTCDYSKLSTASISVGDFTFGSAISRGCTLKCGKVLQNFLLSLFLYCFFLMLHYMFT